MDIQALLTLRDVSRRLSFAAVAEDRGVNPSSISRTISGLEQELGVRLFNRTTRRMTLTEAGAAYLQRIEEILEQLAEAHEAVRSQADRPTGTLKMTASVSYGETIIMPLIPEFRATYPEVKLELMFSDVNFDLVAEGIDLAIRLGALTSHDYIASKLFDTEYIVCASPEYLTDCAPLDTPEDLQNHNCCVFMLRNFRQCWRFRSDDGHEAEIPINSDIAISSAICVKSAALSGLGPALLQKQLVRDDLQSGRLVNIFPDHQVSAEAFDTAAWVLYPSRAYLPRKTRAMIDFLKSRLGN